MRHLLLLVALAGITALRLQAQPAPAALSGIVRDSTGQPLQRVEISYRDVRTTSDSGGYFRLAPVPKGRISVRFARDGVQLGVVEANVTADTTPSVQVDVIGDRTEPRTLRGSVVDSTGAPVRDATVDVVTALVDTRTDSLGRFIVRDLPPRRHILRVRRVGYAPTYLAADLTDSTSARIRIVVRQFAGQNLGLVVVRATRSTARLQGFLARADKKSGWGQILTYDDIQARHPLRTSDVFMAMAGVRVNRNAFGSGTLTGRAGCRMAVFVNGFPVPQRAGAGIDEMVAPQDLAGIEVYNGIGGVPSELMAAGGNSCGTVGIWTR
jgi:hypothetical protein